MIVIDASVILAWAHRDEWTEAIEAILQRVAAEHAIAPAVWPLEVANGLQMAVRRKRIAIPYRDELLASFRRLPIQIEPGDKDRSWANLVYIADRHELTIYDASYLELAMRRGLPLATLDDALIAAAHAEGLPTLP